MILILRGFAVAQLPSALKEPMAVTNFLLIMAPRSNRATMLSGIWMERPRLLRSREMVVARRVGSPLEGPGTFFSLGLWPMRRITRRRVSFRLGNEGHLVSTYERSMVGLQFELTVEGESRGARN